MISQILNFFNQNSASETIDTSFNNLKFPFANKNDEIDRLNSSVTDLVAPPPFHNASWDQRATLICASAG